MKLKIFFALLFAIAIGSNANAQAIVKGSGVVYTNGAPTHSVNFNQDAELVIDTTSGYWYERSRDGLGWLLAGFRVQKFPFSIAPTAAPLDKQSEVLLNEVDSLYRWRSGSWRHLNGVVDGSITNEGLLGVGAGGASSAVLLTNTSTGVGVTINVAGILTISETTSANGGQITLTATEVDGSITNELQTIANTSNSTSHTATLSNSGGSLQVVEGTGIGLATTGTGLNGILTVTNTSPDQTVVLTQGGIVTITGTYPNFTISATEVDGSVTNEAWTIDADDADTEVISNQTVKFQGAGIAVTDYDPATNVLLVTATEVDGSTTNELQTIANSSDATSHTVTLSNSGGTIQFVEGANITLTTSGTSGAGVLTIASTASTPVANNGVSDNEDSGKLRLGNRYMNSPDAPFTMDRKINLNANKFYIGDNTDSTLLQIDGTNDRVGIGTTTPGRKLTVNGEVEIKDMITTTATLIVGADGNGVLSEITIGSGLDLTGNVLTATGGGGGGSTDLSYTGTTSPITLNSSTGTDVTITQGGIVTITATSSNMTISATEVDGSISNEGVLGVGAGSGTSSTLLSTTSGANAVTINAAGILAITESTSANGGSITLTATEVDGSVTNEAWTIDADDADTEVISNQTVKFQGAGITATDYDPATNVLLITSTEVDGSVTNEGTLGVGAGGASSSTLITNTSGGNAVTINVAGINTISESTSANGGSITITATEVDGSLTNEGQLGVGAGGASSAVLLSNTSGATGVTVNVAGILTISETTSANGGQVTLTATEVDGSTTNELQTIANSSDATSHTVTLSNSGGTIQFVEGSNITLTTSGTSGAGVLTIASTSAADGNGPYSGNGGNGGNGTVPSVTNSTLTNQWTLSRATDDVGGLVPFRISVAAGNEPDFMSFVNGSDSLLIGKGDQEFRVVANKGLVIQSSDMVYVVGDSVVVQTTPNAFDNEATLLLQSPFGTVVKAEGLDPDIIRQNGAGTNDVLKWNGSKWAPAADATGSATANNGLSDNENGGNIRLGNRYMNSSDGPFSFDRKINVNAFKLYIGDNTDSTLLMIDGTNDRIGIKTTTASRALHVNGEVRITDLSTTTATLLVGADGNGDLQEISIGSGLSLAANVLSATGGGGGGDVLNNGNSFGAAFIVGSNDNNTVSLEQSGITVFTIGTDKNLTTTNSVAATNTVTDQIKVNINSTGTAANNFGNGILFSGESSTTNDQEMMRLRTYWTTATHANRQAAFSLMLGNNGGALEEVVKVDRAGDIHGIMSVGSTTPVQIYNDAIAPNTTFTFGGNNQNITIGTLAGTIELERQTASTTAPLDFAVNAQSSGTPAAGFGVNLLFLGESNTTVDRTMGNIQTLWTTATDASRTSDMVFNTVNSATTNEAFRIYGNKRAMVGGGTNQSSAALQVNSTTGGFLGPKGTNAEMLAISSPVEGLEFWNTTVQGKCVFDGTDWQRISCKPTPTVTAGTGAGTGATVSVVGNDLAGVITVIAGTSPATNATVVTLDFHTDFDVVPSSVVLTAANEAAVGLAYVVGGNRNWYVNSGSITVDEFILKSGSGGNNAANGTTYKFYYKVGQ